MFTDSSLLPSNSKPFISESQGDSTGTTFETRFDEQISRGDFIPDNVPFVLRGQGHNPDVEDFYSVEGRSLICSTPPRVNYRVVKFRRTFVIDPATKLQIEKRIFPIGRSAEGQPIFNDRLVELGEFPDIFEPHYPSGWIKPSGWESDLESHAELLQRDKTLAADEKKQRESEAEKLKQARAMKENPRSAFAQDLAHALKELGVVLPTKGKAGA